VSAGADLERTLQGMDDYDFEHFVADLWERMGWETEVSTQSTDRGIDVVATRRSPYEEKALIQAKRYGPNTTVGSPAIQQYASLKHQRHGVDKVLVVTTNGFSGQAEELAHQLNVKLVDGTDLVELVEELDATDLVERYVPAVREPKPETEPGTEVERGAVGTELGSVTGGRSADPSRPNAENEGRLTRHLPVERWKWVAGATGLWLLALALGGADGGVSLLLAWAALPYAILKDGTWTRWRRWYAAAALLPFFAMLVGAWYLLMRWRAVGFESAGGVDPDTDD
jgi:restriction system protein